MSHHLTRRHCLLAAGSLSLPAIAQTETSALQKLLEARLKEDGVALAAGRLSDGKSEFAGAPPAARRCRHKANAAFNGCS